MLTNREKLELLLALGPAVFTFLKKDGTVRTMRGTTNFSMIPKEHHPQGLRESHKAELHRVYDLESEGWRSFYWESLQDVQ